MAQPTDKRILERIGELDRDEDVDLNEWEVDFVAKLIDEPPVALSEKQREKALNVLRKYGH